MYKNLDKAFEILHNNPPAPFNPSYSQEAVDLAKRCKDEYRAYENSLDFYDPDFDNKVDKEHIRLCCVYEQSGYKFVNDYPAHPTVKGSKRISELFPAWQWLQWYSAETMLVLSD